MLLMTRREALSRGLPVLGIFRSFAAVGVDPAIMGVGPAVAIPAAVEKVRAQEIALLGVLSHWHSVTSEVGVCSTVGTGPRSTKLQCFVCLAAPLLPAPSEYTRVIG